MSSHLSRTSWIIPNLLVEKTVNLIAGTSRSGKTSLILPMLDQYLTGQGMLDYSPIESRPILRLGALLQERHIESLRNEITELGCTNLSTPQAFPITMLDDRLLEKARELDSGCGSGYPSTQAILKAVWNALAGPPQILLIEAIDDLLPPGPVSARVVRKFMRDAADFCHDVSCTIIGTTGTTKNKAGESFNAPADHVSGFSAWNSGSTTSIIISFLEGKCFAVQSSRRIYFCVRGVEDRVSYARFSKEGRLELGTPMVDDSVSPRSQLSLRLASEPDGSSFVRSAFHEWGETMSISVRTVDRWIAEQLDLGMLDKHGNTTNVSYRKPVTN